MKYLTILFFHIFLFGFVLSTPVDTKLQEKKSIPEAATPSPVKASTLKNINKEQIQPISNGQTEKPATKKRDVPEVLADRSEYFDDDFYEGKPADEYDSIQALKSYLDNSRNAEYRYYNGEARRKRTVPFEGILSRSDGYYEPEIQLTPEDILALAAYKQQQRLYNDFPYGRWSEVSNLIDLPDSEVERDDVYDGRQENFFDRLYNQRFQNWANLPRNDKIITTRRRRSFLTNPKLRVPLYRRTIL